MSKEHGFSLDIINTLDGIDFEMERLSPLSKHSVTELLALRRLFHKYKIEVSEALLEKG